MMTKTYHVLKDHDFIIIQFLKNLTLNSNQDQGKGTGFSLLPEITKTQTKDIGYQAMAVITKSQNTK